MLLCYITDRSQFPGDEGSRRRLLLEKVFEAIDGGVDYVQLREKDLSARELEDLAREVLQTARNRARTALVINSRSDVALAVKAGGVHLRSDDLRPSEVRRIWGQCQASIPVVSVSCHTPEEVAAAAAEGAGLAVFGPVFEKRGTTNPGGLERLEAACKQPISVLAVGGVSLENAELCLQAGAAGIAAIRLFQQNPIADVVAQLRKGKVA